MRYNDSIFNIDSLRSDGFDASIQSFLVNTVLKVLAGFDEIDHSM